MKRTLNQNDAMHLYFEHLAQVLNDAGLDQRVVLKPSIEIPWDKDSIKKQLWKAIQLAKTQKESTTELTTKEVTEVYEILNRHLGEKFGIHVPFPSYEDRQIKSKNQS